MRPLTGQVLQEASIVLTYDAAVFHCIDGGKASSHTLLY
jgi:hypothetical protein